MLSVNADRVMRYLASVGMVKEVGAEQFAPNDLTKTLSVPGNKAGIDIKYTPPPFSWRYNPANINLSLVPWPICPPG